jgi:hypothetical protein
LPSAFFRRKPPVIPEPGQRVRLRSGRGRWRGNFRAISLPYTDEGIGVVIKIAEEKEYRNAVREGRHVFGIPWPAHQIEVLSPSKNAEQETQELPLNQRPRPRWRFWG